MKIQKFFSFRGQAPWPPYIKSVLLKRWKTWHFLHQVLCPPIDICSHWQGLFMIEGVFLYWPVFKLPRIAGIERGIFVTCDKWRYDTLKIMEMRAIYKKVVIPTKSILFEHSNPLWIAIKSKVTHIESISRVETKQKFIRIILWGLIWWSDLYHVLYGSL